MIERSTNVRTSSLFTLAALLVLSLSIAACDCDADDATPDPENGGEAETLPDGEEFVGEDTPEQLKELSDMDVVELKDFLKDFTRNPALRVEAMRLLVERTENRKELFPILIASLKAPTIREREAVLYYFSRFGTPNHIVAIEASALGIEDCSDYSTLSCNCITYSIECTTKQIMQRAGDRMGE